MDVVDPGLRLRLRERGPEGYFLAFPLDTAMDGIMAVGEVVNSRAEGFAAGDTVWHAAGWRDYAIVDPRRPALGGLGTLTRLDVDAAPPQAYLGPSALPITRWPRTFANCAARLPTAPAAVETQTTSPSRSAAASNSPDHAVSPMPPSDEKVTYLLDELGLDAAPDGIDVYFDNVGGDHLEAALGALRPWGRVALCGAISDYERSTPAGPTNLFQATANNLTLRGFRGSAHLHLMAEMQREVETWLREGRIKYRESVTEGLENAPAALVDLLAGRNLGKTLVRIG